jgi:ssDNA-binding Zn-finger/Zn-ribbon topoisomerase 1
MAKTNISGEFIKAGKALFTVFNGVNDWYTFAVDKDGDTYTVRWFAGKDNMKPSSYDALGTMGDDLALTVPPKCCPKCEGGMVQRTRRSDDKPFMGCRRFPECNGARDIDPREATAIKAFRFGMLVVLGAIPAEMYPAAEVMHANRCCKCRRALTTPESITKGIGPECSGEKRAAPKRKKNKTAETDAQPV